MIGFKLPAVSEGKKVNTKRTLSGPLTEETTVLDTFYCNLEIIYIWYIYNIFNNKLCFSFVWKLKLLCKFITLYSGTLTLCSSVQEKSFLDVGGKYAHPAPSRLVQSLYSHPDLTVTLQLHPLGLLNICWDLFPKLVSAKKKIGLKCVRNHRRSSNRYKQSLQVH